MPAKFKNRRLTIGMLTADIRHKNDYSMWQGVVDAARKRDVNVICFPGLHLHSPVGFDVQATAIFELVSAEKLDGLVIMAGAIAQMVGPDEKKAFLERFSPLPIVTLESDVAGIPDIYVDFFENMRQAILHLIQGHNYRRIAFIRGPEGHKGANERYRAYTEALAESGIPFDPTLVTPPLKWDGRVGITWLLDQQHADFEALVAVNDDAAMGAIEILQGRGIRVPEEVAVIGFDDVDQGRWITPPLTTVPLETYTSGQQALEMVLTMIEGKQVPEQVIIPTELVIRQSCGCIDPMVTQAVVEPPTILPKNGAEQIALATVLPDQQADILAAIKQTVKEEILKAGPDQIGQLLEAFAAEQSNPANSIFLPLLDQLLSQTMALGGEVEAWQQVVSVLRRRMFSYLPDNESLLWAENLWQQARILIGQVAQRKQGYQEVVAERRMTILREVGEALVTTFDSEALMNVLAHQLPRLDIRSAYLSLYEDPKHPAGQARLIMAYNQQGRIELEAGSHVFSAPHLIPQELWPHEQAYSMVALPLYLQKDQLGFVLFEANSQDGPIYMALRGQISSALKGALLVEQEEKRARQLQIVTEVGSVVATILDTTELLQSVVDLTKASFNLYHTHIYLLNETPSLEEEGQEGVLVLAAGAGNVGRQMVAQGWHIPLKKEQSLVARAARTRQGVIENYVRQAPDWLPNPLLPHTHSELAVPMVAGDRVLGVLDIQSDRVNDFSEEDVRIQTTLATQVAVALQNSRSFAEQQQAKLLLAKRVRELNCLNEVGREIVEAPAIADLLQWVTERIPLAMQYPELCVVAIEYDGQVYGVPKAIELPAQIVNALRIGAEVMGRIYISYTEKHDFLDEESALLGGIASRVSGYIENRRLFKQWQQRADELEEATSFLDSIVENIPVGIFVKTAEDLRYVSWNKANADLVGRSRDEILGKNDYEYLPKAQADHFSRMDRLVLADGKLVDIPEESIQTAHKGLRYLRTRKVPLFGLDGKPKYLLGISDDITERKQVEERLQQANLVVESSPVVLFRWQAGAAWPVDFVSTNVAQFGYTAEEFLSGMIPYASLVYPNDWARIEQEVHEYRTSGVNQFQLEYRIVTRAGQIRWVDHRSVVERDAQGEVTHYQGTIIDITERKEAAAEHERLLAEVEAAYRHYVRQEWEKYLGEQQGGWRIEHQLVDQPIEPASQTLDRLQHEVIREGKTRVVNGASNGHEVEPTLVAPITLRGQVIGTLSLQDIALERRWTDEERALVETVSEQLALTVENLRLFDTTQKRATREALTREIADKIRQANTVEEILETSVAELSKTLGVSRVFIDLTTEESAG